MLSLSIQNALVRGNNGRVVLIVPELKIQAGITVGIRGPSGAGKSTLLHLLVGLISPSQGKVVWGQTELSALSEHKKDNFRRNQFGIIFQDSLLFEELSPLANASIAANFAPRKDRQPIKRKAAECLEKLNVPFQNNNKVDTMSGGERQRISVARALATDPGIIIADEPTAALDRENADNLIADLLSIARSNNKTLITVSHDSNFLTSMDEIIEIKDGLVNFSKTIK